MYDWAIFEGKQKRDDYWRGERSRVSKAFEEYKKTNPYATQAEMEDYFKREAGGDAWMFQPQSEVLGKLASNNLAAKNQADVDAQLAEVKKRTDLTEGIDKLARSIAENSPDGLTGEQLRELIKERMPALNANQLSPYGDPYIKNVNSKMFLDRQKILKELAAGTGYEYDKQALSEALNVPLQKIERYNNAYKGLRADAQKQRIRDNGLKVLNGAFAAAERGQSAEGYIKSMEEIYPELKGKFDPTVLAEIKAVFSKVEDKRETLEKERQAGRLDDAMTKIRDFVGSQQFGASYLTGRGAIGQADNSVLKQIISTAIADPELRALITENPQMLKAVRDQTLTFLEGSNANTRRIRADALEKEAEAAMSEDSSKAIREGGFNNSNANAYKAIALAAYRNVGAGDPNNTDMLNAQTAIQSAFINALNGYSLSTPELQRLAYELSLDTSLKPNSTATDIRNTTAFQTIAGPNSSISKRNEANKEISNLFGKGTGMSQVRTSQEEALKASLESYDKNYAGVLSQTGLTKQEQVQRLESLKFAIAAQSGKIIGALEKTAKYSQGEGTALIPGKGNESVWDENWANGHRTKIETDFAKREAETQAKIDELKAEIGAETPPEDTSGLASAFNFRTVSLGGGRAQPVFEGFGDSMNDRDKRNLVALWKQQGVTQAAAALDELLRSKTRMTLDQLKNQQRPYYKAIDDWVRTQPG